ncbi:LuxR C-terminal-related transcriptional regulator [Kitasatospora sp. NPDC056076]|uniref:LuxR C-terminal-related transcriptional regulator n=1 Tax=Kitasatospora sp. NPDC056076 TaxID=3345703 RepID=UPI0035DC085F
MKVDTSGATADQNLLSPEAKQLYRQLLSGSDTAPQPGNPLDELLGLRLAAPDAARPGHYTALNASAAALHWQSHLQNLGSRYLSQAASVASEMNDLIGAYQMAQPSTGGAIEYLAGLDVIQDRLTPLLAACESELFTAQPNGPRPAAQLALSYQRDIAVLQRGVKMHTINHYTARRDEPTARWAATVTVHGAKVRTVAQRFPRTVIIDRKTAVTAVLTPWEGQGAPPDERALIIHDEAVVRCLATMMDLLWGSAMPWTGGTFVEVTPMQKTILEGLVRGDGLEVIGRTLGVTPRTVSTHLAPLREAVGVESLPQLTYWYGRHEAHYQDVSPLVG